MFFPARLIYIENKNSAEVSQSEKTEAEQNKERLGLKEEAQRLCARLPDDMPGGRFSQWAETFEKNDKLSAARGSVEWLKNAAKNADKIKTADGLKAQLRASPLLGQAAAAYIDQYEAWQKTGAMSDSQSEQKNSEFLAWVQAEMSRLPKRAAMQGKFNNFKKQPAAGEAVDDLVLKLGSKAQGGFNKEVRGVVDDEAFNQMSLKQQEAYLGALEDAYDKNIDDTHPKVLAERDKLLANPRMPKSYKKGLNNPESWGSGKTLKEVVSWIKGAGLAELGLLEARWDRAGERIYAKKGLVDFYKDEEGKPLLDEKDFWEGGRKERADYLDGFEQIERKYDAAESGRQESSEAAGQAVVTETSTELEQSVVDRKEMATEKTRELAEIIKNSVAIQKMRADYEAAKLAQQAEKSGEQAASFANEASNARAGAVAGAGTFGGTIKSMFGFGQQQPEAARDDQPAQPEAANDDQPSEQNAEAAFLETKDPVEAQALDDTVEHAMGNKNAVEEIQKVFQLTNASDNKDVEVLMRLVTQKDFITNSKEISSVFSDERNAVGSAINNRSDLLKKTA